MPDPDGGAAEVSGGAEDKRAEESGGTGRAGGAEIVGGILEVTRPPG